MKRIVKTIEKLLTPAKPLEFLTDIGIEKEEGEQIIMELKAVLQAKPELTALAAPQIGINSRIFCIRFNDTIKTFINPIITKKSGVAVAPETFLNIPDTEFLIARPEEITAVYYTDEFKYEDNKFLGPAARVFDQQAQILDGILPNELGIPFVLNQDSDNSVIATFDEIARILNDSESTPEEQDQAKAIYNAFVNTYKTFIRNKTSEYEQSIKDNPDVQEAYKRLKFTESVINGRTALVTNTSQMNREQRRALKFNKNNINGKVKKLW